MTVAAWEHLVRDVLPRIEGEQQLNAAMAAAVPHMTEDGRQQTLQTWQQAAMTVVRQVARAAAGSQVRAFRTFLRRGGINPESGTEDPNFR